MIDRATTSDAARPWNDADAYERYIGRWSRKVVAQLVAWLDVPQGGRWLDLGCGTGALTAAILERAQPSEVVGVDPSASFIEVARARLADPRVELRRGSSDAIPYPDGRADAAACAFVLNFVDDKTRALQELIRCVKPSGRIAAAVWDYAGHAQFMRHFWNAAAALDPAAAGFDEGRRAPICRPEPLRELFRSLGLSSIEVEAIDVITQFADFDDYWLPLLRGAGPAPKYCATLDDDARTQLRERLRSQLPVDDAGTILLVARAWAIKAVRPGEPQRTAEETT